jgi:TRAP-type mannitol/chloroaromatic compound transport system permease small subunit
VPVAAVVLRRARDDTRDDRRDLSPMTSFLARIADALDALSRMIGGTVKWFALLLVLLQFVVVGLRYIYGSSFIWMQESVIYTHATLFMLAIGYTFLLDQHVRVDVLYAGWTAQRRALVDLVGILVAVLPFCALVIWASSTYVSMSWRLGEGPMQVGGLPLLPYLKTLIPVMAALLFLQGVSIAIRCLLVLAGQATTHFPGKPMQASHG